MKGKEIYSVCVLADNTRIEDLRNKYSFINNIDGGNFQMVGQDSNPDFFVIDLDMPDNNLGETVVDHIEELFICRPIIFVKTERDQHRSPLEIISDEKIGLAFIKNFCKKSIPCCESIDDLEKALKWFRFIFKKNVSAGSQFAVGKAFNQLLMFELARTTEPSKYAI